MTAKRMIRVTARIATVAATTTSLAASVLLAASAHAAPVKLVPSGAHITAGLEFPAGVGVAPSGNIYVADHGHARVQEFTAGGEFVLMFGKGVNKKGGDLCTKAEASECQAGIEGVAAGQIAAASSVTVSPSGDVYVAEFVFGEGAFGKRVQEFTAEGRFVLEIGEEVNETTKANLCSQEEVEKGVKCGAPRLYSANEPPVSEPGAFDFQQFMGDLLAVGGPKNQLYVGDNGRVQEFEASSGKWVGEIPVACDVGAVAVDETGDVYALCNQLNTIEELNPGGADIDSFSVTPRENANEIGAITGIALDSSGNLAVSADEARGVGNVSGSHGPFGLLFNAATGHLITDFAIAGNNTFRGMVFEPGDRLYATVNAEVVEYGTVSVGELVTSPVSCKPGPDKESDATLSCALNGMVDAWGVSNTRAWFEWGATPHLGEVTKPPLPIANTKSEGEEEPFASVTAPVEGLRPNANIYARLAGEDANVLAPELLTSETVSLHTPLVLPRIVGRESASFVGSASAVLSGALNPENAATSYRFQYVSEAAFAREVEDKPCEWACAADTGAEEYALYGPLATTIEARGLSPATTYRYRLTASNRREVGNVIEGGEATGPEATFTTAPAPVPFAVTGAASGIGATSAAISGTVDPDGQPAVYSFEVGVYNPAGTQYGVVLSEPAGEATTPIEQTQGLTGLQPGTTYAFRIKIASGYGTSTGETATFTTEGLPAVLGVPSVLPMLAAPPIAFPTLSSAPPAKCKRGYKLAAGEKCVKARKKKPKLQHTKKGKKK